MKFLKNLVSIAAVLALLVVMLGAYTRLTDAGLGCPDWPGCYGHLVLPQNQQTLHEIGQHFTQKVESKKAWTEMVHRYAAGTLGLFIMVIAAFSIKSRRLLKNSVFIPSILPLLVIFQALLGMWTVTLKLLPIVVMAHLLGGMLIFSLLVCYRMQLAQQSTIISSTPTVLQVAMQRIEIDRAGYHWRWIAMIGLILLFCQIALGGWVSANYAGIACVGFPRCNGQWLPALQWAKGFYLLSPVGANYQGGVLDVAVRVTIQFIHRMGAFVVFIYLLIFSCTVLYRFQHGKMQWLAIALLFLLIIQFVLGIINVTYILPLFVAVAHNGVAAMLLSVQVVMVYLLNCSHRT